MSDKRQRMGQARVNVAKKQRPVDLIRLLVRENPTLTVKVIQHWLKNKSGQRIIR